MKNFYVLLLAGILSIGSAYSQCQASFTYQVNGNTVSFTNTSTTDSSTAMTWQWTFGDGNFSGNNDPSHTYLTPGTYQVCLFIVDFTLCPTNPTMQFCDSVTIPANNPCQASFTYQVNGSTVNFTNTSTTDSSTAMTWQWSFGDGSFSSNNDPSHTYSAPGTYQVCLFIVDFTLCPTNPTMQFCDSVTIAGTNPCQASFTYTQNGNTVSFTNTSSTDSVTSDQFQWSFGDGSFSGATDPVHTYPGPGTYYVCLLIVDFDCNPNPTMQYCDSITIYPVGLEEQQALNSRVYPNPVQDQLNFQFDSRQGMDLKLEVTNILGELIASQEVRIEPGKQVVTVNTSAWTEGTYIVRMVKDRQVLDWHRIIK
ncbi:MAG: PKD domain-containing protein [Flavobacteriales bacterium]|nr:PKD domain-containing protein [Flavobacteriales bacterium]